MQGHVVHEPRLPVFRTRDLCTKAELVDLAFKEHPGLRIGTLFNLNAVVAYDMIMNERLFSARQDLVDTTLAMVARGDREEISVMQQAILDEADFAWWPKRPGADL